MISFYIESVSYIVPQNKNIPQYQMECNIFGEIYREISIFNLRLSALKRNLKASGRWENVAACPETMCPLHKTGCKIRAESVEVTTSPLRSSR